jgi:dihydroorotase
MDDILILNGTLINENQRIRADMAIQGGRIRAIAGDLSGTPARTTIDAGGKWVLPGMIDDQVHFREPGLTHKGDIASESRAAMAGGITSYMEMPNTSPQTTTIDALEDKYERASKKSPINFAFYLGATNDNLEVIKSLDPRAACGLKVFMGASTGNMLVDNPDTLEQIFAHSPVLIATHCEDSPTISRLEKAAIAQHGEAVPVTMHPDIRSAEACHLSSSLAVRLARKHGARLHVLHLTTAREMALFDEGDIDGKRITAEACVHHLWFSSEDYLTRGNDIKCNPAIKTAEDRAALRQALVSGRIDIIATDHAPHTREEKDQPYLKAPAGLPLVQYALVCALELTVQDPGITPEMVVQKTSHNVARRFDIIDRGFLREGYFADIVIIDPDQPTGVTREQVLSKCGWSPFEGLTFRHSVHSTIVNGIIKYQQGQVLDTSPGMRLRFDR